MRSLPITAYVKLEPGYAEAQIEKFARKHKIGTERVPVEQVLTGEMRKELTMNTTTYD